MFGTEKYTSSSTKFDSAVTLTNITLTDISYSTAYVADSTTAVRIGSSNNLGTLAFKFDALNIVEAYVYAYAYNSTDATLSVSSDALETVSYSVPSSDSVPDVSSLDDAYYIDGFSGSSTYLSFGNDVKGARVSFVGVVLTISGSSPVTPSSSSSSSQSSSSSSSSSSSQVDYPDVDLGEYYKTIDTSATGDTLGLSLHNLMIDTHSYYTTYGEIRYTFGATDGDASNPGNLIDFYSHESYDATWDGSYYNREHVWCQSLSAGLWADTDNSTTGGGSDMLHLRPTKASYNSSRGNKPYGEVQGGSGVTTTNYGYYNTSTFEPFDNVKGNVARIIFYVYLHYGNAFGGESNSYVGNLSVTSVVNCASEAAAWEMLLEWNTLDPVDELEQTLNDVACYYQGNRNPFIDYPNFATQIWG